VATIQTAADWQKQWFEIADATYLNTAAHAAIPRVALQAVQTSIEVNKSPHHMDDVVFFEAPSRIRASLSKMIGRNRKKSRSRPGQAPALRPWLIS
jgi:hypothetical protein